MRAAAPASARPAGSARPAAAIVDLAIAVVVDVVGAHLVHRHHVGLTRRAALHAHDRSRLARPRQTRVAGRTTAGVAVVDEPVAVVIEAVAHLDASLPCRDTRERSVLALRQPYAANAELAGVAATSSVHRVVVGDAVAVV